MEFDYRLLGSRIRSVRKKKKLTQESLAELCGISLSFVGHVERGTRKLSLGTFDKICRALECSADELLGLRGISHKEISFMIDQLIAELEKRK